jgi:hypothetical protein
MNTDIAKHLSKKDRITQGSYYTPQRLVDRVYEFIDSYIVKHTDKVVIFDSAGGYGAFLANVENNDYRIADIDKTAVDFLKERYNPNKIFLTNTLLDVEREKYNISDSTFLIMIGNPPYNDTTSEFKNGRKGKNVCDIDLFDRDMGISFLKSYTKMDADVVCVLHPLSYLIKETNFKRLKLFRSHYKLIRGEIFSSEMFYGTGSAKFPILIALYERDYPGMSYDYIRNFEFGVMDSKESFKLTNYNTTDGYITKYPPRKNDVAISPIGLYYYTFRDMNSLKKNTSFMDKKHYNGIVITIENFYKYAYLYSIKTLFNPKNSWLYGNLSPLINIDDLEKNKDLFVSYALRTNKLLKDFNKAVIKKISYHYNLELNKNDNLGSIEHTIKKLINRLV